ncbi:MAG: hemerythrin domain-containing protein [Methanotrichaceae archaeon]
MDMNVIDIIKQDHGKALNALSEAKDASKSRDIDQSWANVKKLLCGHMHAEETVVYPVLKEFKKEDILEGIEEHNVAKILIEQMDDAPRNDVWAAKLKVLTESIEHHIEEEEEKILPADRLSAIGLALSA